jgi:hypothetical protein
VWICRQEEADAAAFLEQYAADAAARTRALGATGMAARNAAALDRALKLRAAHKAHAKHAWEAVLAHTKRVERASTFVPGGATAAEQYAART